MKAKEIKQSVILKATPKEVYDALMNEKKHTLFTGSKAKISEKVGGVFTAYDGGLSGKNMKLVEAKEIVQSWRCEMPHWPKGHYSEVKFSLKKVPEGTKLDFSHKDVPEGAVEDISKGWEEHYWKKLKKFFEEE